MRRPLEPDKPIRKKIQLQKYVTLTYPKVHFPKFLEDAKIKAEDFDPVRLQISTKYYDTPVTFQYSIPQTLNEDQRAEQKKLDEEYKLAKIVYDSKLEDYKIQLEMFERNEAEKKAKKELKSKEKKIKKIEAELAVLKGTTE